jgi:hypothetical protein
VQQISRWVFVSLGLAAALHSGWASAASQDAEAQELADQAIFTDYLQLDFAAGEKKLLKAIKLCETGSCSPTVQAQVYRDLAVIYITGMKRPDDGRKLLVRALQLDPRVALDADLTTPDLVKVFAEAKDAAANESEEEDEAEDAEVEPEAPPKAAPAAPPKAAPKAAPAPPEAPVGSLDEDESADCPPDFPGCDPVEDKSPAEEEDEASRDLGVRNWLSAGLQQDFLMFSGTSGVCNVDRPEELSCFRAGDEFRDPRSVGTAGDGGEVGGGFRPATTRLVIGYERTFWPNITLGGRVGYAIGGGPAEPNGPGFLPIHVEVRGSYWLAPLEPHRIRPYLTLSGGVAQVDGSVTTQLVDRSAQGEVALSRVTVWKKTGTTFGSFGGGLMYPLNDHGGITAELKAMVLFPSSGLSMSLQAGYSHGF